LPRPPVLIADRSQEAPLDDPSPRSSGQAPASGATCGSTSVQPRRSAS